MTAPPESLATGESLAELSPEVRAAICEHARRVTFTPGDRLVPFGRAPDRMLILRRGLAKQVGHSLEGRERILAIYRPGEIVGAAVSMDAPCQECDVIAMTRMECLALGRRDVWILGRTYPSLMLALAREVSRQLLAMTKKFMSVTSEDVPVRLSQLLLEFAGDDPDRDRLVPLAYPLTHECMSQIVGASRPHVSTMLRDLESAGAVRRGRSRNLLVRRSRLARIVEAGALVPPEADAARLTA